MGGGCEYEAGAAGQVHFVVYWLSYDGSGDKFSVRQRRKGVVHESEIASMMPFL